MSNQQNINGIPTRFISKYGIMLQRLTTFRKIQDENTLDLNLKIPAPSSERVVTDRKGFLIYGVALLICLPILLKFSTEESDVRVLIQLLEPKSVSSESEINELHGWKLEDQHHNYGTPDPWLHCRKGWWKFLLSVLCTIAVCTFVLFLIKFCPRVVIWLAMAGIFSLLIMLIYMGIKKLSDTFSTSKYPTTPQFLIVVLSVVFTITCAIVLIYRMRSLDINCLLYQEASRMIFPTSKLLMLTLPSVIIQLAILAFSINAAIAIMGPPSRFPYYGVNRFRYSHAKGFFLLLNVLITNWTMHLFGGFQCMVTAGSVAARYYSGVEELPNWRICRSFRDALKYHLGTAAFGSAIQPIVAIGEKIARFYSCYGINSCSKFLPAEIKFTPLSNKNAYIMSALHGQSYRKSGKRAFSLLLMYAPFFYIIKSRGSIVLLVLKLDLLFCCTGFSYLLFSDGGKVWFPTILCLFANFVIVSIFLETLETAAHTLVISECEEEFIRGNTSRAHHRLVKHMDLIFEKSEDMYEREIEDREKYGTCGARIN